MLASCSALNTPRPFCVISPSGTSGHVATQELGDTEVGVECCLWLPGTVATARLGYRFYGRGSVQRSAPPFKDKA